MKENGKMIKEMEKEEYFHNGDRYEGEHRNGNGEGKGIYYYYNGDRYEGDFKNGKSEGK